MIKKTFTLVVVLVRHHEEPHDRQCLVRNFFRIPRDTVPEEIRSGIENRALEANSLARNSILAQQLKF
jgi:hypothetical protein